jgi:V/A-type H+-transporting ATPase subunit C
MDREKFVRASAEIRVKEKQFLDKATLDRIIDAKDLSEAIGFLNDTVYQEFFKSIEKPQDYEEALIKEQKKTFDEMYKISPDRRVIDLVANNYNYHNIKVYVKDRLLSSELSHLYINIGDVDWIDYSKATGDEVNIKEEYAEVIDKASIEYQESKSAQNIDIVVDKLYIESLKDLADQMGVDLFKEYVKELIDFTNINTFLRCQRQERDVSFLDYVLYDGGNVSLESFKKIYYGDIEADSPIFRHLTIGKYVKKGIEAFKKTGSLSEFERQKDNYFIDLIKNAKRITYGPEVVFAYLYAKEMEIKNLKIIFICKLNGVESSLIKERLRDSYV